MRTCAVESVLGDKAADDRMQEAHVVDVLVLRRERHLLLDVVRVAVVSLRIDLDEAVRFGKQIEAEAEDGPCDSGKPPIDACSGITSAGCACGLDGAYAIHVRVRAPARARIAEHERRPAPIVGASRCQSNAAFAASIEALAFASYPATTPSRADAFIPDCCPRSVRDQRSHIAARHPVALSS